MWVLRFQVHEQQRDGGLALEQKPPEKLALVRQQDVTESVV